jgi:general secretion pathway protein F
MARFSYKALSGSGTVLRGRMEAPDAERVLQALRRQGHLPIEVWPSRAAWLTLSARPKRMDGAQLAMATRELSMLIQAGQTAEQAFQLLASGTAPKSLRAPFGQALARLREGEGLADALTGAGFPPIYRAMVQAGEAGGALAGQLAQLASLLERAARLREQLVSALIYPALLICVSIGAVILLLGMVVPQFAPLFAESHKALPFATRMVLGASETLRSGWRIGLGGLGLALALGLVAARRPAIGAWADEWLLRVPVVGRLMLLAASTRWMRVLAVLLKGGVPLPAALDLVKPVAGHRALQSMISVLKDGIRDGKGLTASMPPNPPLPDPALPLLRVGEQGGQLAESLGHLADLFDSRLEQGLKRTMALFEPACVLLLSAMVGTIVISILLAVVSINDLAL